MRVCFVTHRSAPAVTDDDGRAAEACRARGLDVVAGAWDDPSVEWGGFDRVVLRSTWNYHLAPDRFDAWLDRLAAEGIPVWNPVPVVRWNARKTYLGALGDAGVPVVPTRVLVPGAVPAPDRWAADFGTAEAVVKPTVGASAHGVLRLRLDGVGIEDRLREAAAHGPVLVQPFEAAVQERGEWSAIFLGGQYSHAVLKRPAHGDFRVQEELGGQSVPGEAPASVRALGRAALARVPGPTLYARVDAVEAAEGPRLMELELIEPALYFRADPEAAARFASRLAETPNPAGA